MKDVVMYTLSTCPWCRKTKKYFTDNNIPLKYVEYDLNRSGAGTDRTGDEERGSAFVSLGAHREATIWSSAGIVRDTTSCWP
jgi:hypothetical protein